MSTADVGTAVDRGAWFRVAVLTFATFAVGTLEFVLAGVLPEFSRSLGVSVGAAGQTVTVFAVTCAVLAPLLAATTATWHRRAALLLAIGLYLAGVLLTALAPSFAVVLLGMAVAAAGAGLFIPTASVTASALVPPSSRGRAIAAVTIGLTSATALGAPIGTVVGTLFGWRATIWFVAALAVLALGCLAAWIPALEGMSPTSVRQRLAPLTDRRILTVLGTTLATFTAVYIVYTYISVVFEPATGGSGTRLAVLMFVWGTVGTFGNLAAGAWSDRVGARRVVSTAVAVLAISFLILPWTTGTYISALVVIVVYGLAAWAVTAPQQHRLITLTPSSAALVVSLNAAFLYLAIALSGVIGAVGIEIIGKSHLSYLAAGIAILALSLSEWAHRQGSRAPTTSLSTRAGSNGESPRRCSS
ncbi:MFS transporter, DHA1 family, arabinose polymer transporter [Actinopolyspora alba]|uniref:MFS transporter, DHA1 family, arabinose polymer transporter n=1 Tax=Actinopolyspora alba TaxID=673379 RepID=A0A1I2AB90_9ACTN|nr:MFS transporter [Actinopolyspora alba]SFE41294.1 MFS transporter, DHA1 family, arabinose polymer transporter [Actinopolyspora alba]